jgi:hypothetical protein
LFIVPLCEGKKTKTTTGMWGVVEFSSDLYPDFEIFEVSFWSTGRAEGLEEYYNYTLIYISGYRLKINNSMISYVQYDDPADFIKPLEIVHMKYKAGDFNMSEIGYGYQEATLELIAANETSQNVQIPDDYVQFEIFFDREATSSEVLNIVLIIFLPSFAIIAVVFIKFQVDKVVIENITLRNFFPIVIREIRLVVIAHFRSFIDLFRKKLTKEELEEMKEQIEKVDFNDDWKSKNT